MPLLRDIIERFSFGQIDTLEARKIPRGASSGALDWLNYGDRIELRRGYKRKGGDDGTGRVTGIHVAIKNDGTQVLYKTYARKLKYYDEATSAFIEVGSDIIPAAASGEDIVFGNYASLAGSQTFFTSPNSGLYKIMTANPGSYTDLTDSSKNFKGRLRIFFNRIILWGRTADKTGIYGSYIDSALYTTVTGEATVSLGGTLAFKGGGATRTCFGVVLVIAGQTFTDDYSGNLVGNSGGTGTINYTTGAYTVSVAGIGTAAYQWEDSNNKGLGDFTKSGTRLAGEGFVFRQDDGGGDAQSVGLYGEILYCLHKYRTWQLAITQTDTNATNLPYRDRVGIPNHKAQVSTGDGIYYIDDTDLKDTQLRLLSLDKLSSIVIPSSISKRTQKGITLGIDLSNYRFNLASMIEWGDFVLIACRTSTSTVNNRVITYNKKSGALNYQSFFVSHFAIYNGALVAGDSATNNVYELFVNFDDDDALIARNVYTTEMSDHEIKELKRTKKIIPQGLIGPEQYFKVSASIDNGPYTEIGTIRGDGDYVDKGSSIVIGSSMIGDREIGGGGSGTVAYNFEHPLTLALGKYEHITLRFEALGLGFLSINKYTWYDVRKYGKRLPKKYR